MKLRSSTKIAAGFALFVGAGLMVTKGYTFVKLGSVDMKPIEPGKFCLMAIGKEANVKILSVNRMVQVVETSSGFGGASGSEGGAESGSIKGRIPMKELLAVLGGDQASVAGLLERIERKDDSEAPSEDAPFWTAADIQKAIDGDAVLRKRLEADINCTLEGQPLSSLNPVAFYSGIRVECPVRLEIENASGKPLEGGSIKTYRPRFIVELYKKLESTFYDKAGLQDRYRQFIAERNPMQKEDPRQNLKALFSVAKTEERFQKAKRVSSASKIIVNREMVVGASWKEELVGKDATYTLSLRLSEEGSNRLWKYSTEHPGDKIIVVSNSVPIAAASVETALNSQELVIKQIADRTLVEETVKLLEKK